VKPLLDKIVAVCVWALPDCPTLCLR
jgi:hypothetical protein